jgi:UDP-N-acetylmuramoyl-L-alanyl-D-glutamate--2,6-diaminopimelate ligase
MSGISLRELLQPWVQVPERDDRRIRALSLNSREIAPQSLFVALAGGTRHGLEFLEAALSSGAVAVVAEPGGPDEQAARAACAERGVPLFVLAGFTHEVSRLAGRFYGEPSRALPIVGVTGTDGKTSVTQFIAQALNDPQAPCGVIGTLGYGEPDALHAASHTTPDAIRVQGLLAELRMQGAQAVAMEVSSHALDQGRVADVRFAVAVLTNLSRDHLDYHGTLEAYAEAKARLFRVEGLQCAVLNQDDAFGRQLHAELAGRVPILGYSMDPAALDAELTLTDIEFLPEGLRVTLRARTEAVQLALPLLGRFNAANVMATLGALLGLGIPLQEALSRLQRLRPVAGRMERFGGGKAPLAIVDYAHTPAALAAALQAVREHVPGRLWCVFGCGGDRDRGKRPQMGAVAERYADELVLTDDNPRGENPEQIVGDILAGVSGARPQIVRDRASAIRAAIDAAAPGDAVLIAGKGHEQEQLIGARRLPFDDRAVALAALQERSACSR